MAGIRKIKKRKMKVPRNRKLMIRDLPIGVAHLLHPSLRGILTGRQKRWNSGSPSHRIAVNLVKRYKRQPKPRVFPFFCEKCKVASRYLSKIREHRCDKEDKKKAFKKEAARKYVSYDCTQETKLALNPEKNWRSNSMAIMEKSLRPNQVLPIVEKIEKSTELESVDPTPDEKFLQAQEEEYEDDNVHYALKDVLVAADQDRPKTTLKPLHCDVYNLPGVFCFVCKDSFESYNQYQLHLFEDYKDGKCSRELPNYYYTQRNDKTGAFNPALRHSLVRHREMKRDVSHVQCTLCKETNFASTELLYSHMIKCASNGPKIDGVSPIDRPTVFGYGMPPSFSEPQFVFDDPCKTGVPFKGITSNKKLGKVSTDGQSTSS